MAYTKLFASIVTSTIWTEDDQTRIVWITMLASANKNGEVHASVPGLARIAGVSIEACEKALAKFLAPDPYSRTKDDEGRRIEEIDGGWALINHAKYRALASKDEIAASNAERQRRHRERVKRNGNGANSNGTVTHGRDIADTDTKADSDAEAEAKKEEEFLLVPPTEPDASLRMKREEVKAQWNLLPDLPNIRHISEGRTRTLNSRLKDRWWEENWREAIRLIPSSSFLMGRVPGRNGGKPFKADFDFFIQPDTVAKILERKYHGEQPALPATGETPKRTYSAADHMRAMGLEE